MLFTDDFRARDLQDDWVSLNCRGDGVVLGTGKQGEDVPRASVLLDVEGINVLVARLLMLKAHLQRGG
jgi:hypothetical protein